MNRKLFFIPLAFAVSFLCGCSGCAEDDNSVIALNFDKQEAYFTGKTELYPISGETPAEGEAVEEATVIISADRSAVLKLCLMYWEGQSDIEGLMIAVDGAAAQTVCDGMVLYQSAEAETEKTLNLQIYLSKDSPYTEAGKSLSFVFELTDSAEETGD